ncbi:MAG: hypothetical protein ACFFD2_24720, partial [Promethearchaeota archaeon]
MANKMKSKMIFNKDLSEVFDKLDISLREFKREQNSKFKSKIKELKLDYSDKTLLLDIISDKWYPHSFLFQIRNRIIKEFGRKYSLSVKDVIIYNYEIKFPIDNPPLTKISIPFVDNI